MFRKSIPITPFTTDTADAYFQNIQGQSFDNDSSFLATLRALVAPRIEDSDRIYLKFTKSYYGASEIKGVSANKAVTAICSGYNLDAVNGLIVIHSFASGKEDNLANFQVISDGFSSCYEGYHRLDKIKAFYHKSFEVDCYINPERKNVIVFVDNLDIKKLHYLQVSILAFLPWYFDPKAGLSELEMELLHSLRETTPDKYENCIARIAESYDFNSVRVRRLLSGFETRYERLECERVRQEIQDFDAEMARLNCRIGDILGRKNESCIKLLGLERKIAERNEDSEIMEYLLCNKRLYLEDVTQQNMYFSVKDYLTYFDREIAERAINSQRSFVYPYGNSSHNGITADEMKKLMTEIFVSEEPRLRIKFCAAYTFDLNGNVEAQGGHEFPVEFRDCMPNPHINRYRCLGNYLITINELLKDRNYIGALEQCVASCKSLNWGDSIVMESFMETMWGDSHTNNRCIELPDGKMVNSLEAIKWLEAQKAVTNEHDTKGESNE